MRNTITEDNFFDESKALTSIEIGTIPEVIGYFKTSAEKGETQRVTVLSWLYTFQKRVPLVIGDILLDWELRIKTTYNKAKEYQEKTGQQGDLPVKNLFEWFNKNPDRIPFGYKEARHYLTYRTDREQILLEAPEKLKQDVPIKHNNIIRQIKDTEIREKIRKKVVEEGLTAEKTKELVNKVILKEEKQEVIQKTKKKVHISITQEDNNIIIECGSATIKDYANQYILERWNAMKEYIADKIK